MREWQGCNPQALHLFLMEPHFIFIELIATRNVYCYKIVPFRSYQIKNRYT